MIIVRAHYVVIIFINTNTDFNIKIIEKFNGSEHFPRWSLNPSDDTPIVFLDV